MPITYETLNLLATLGDKEAKAASFYCQEYPHGDIHAHSNGTFEVFTPRNNVCGRLSSALRKVYGV